MRYFEEDEIVCWCSDSVEMTYFEYLILTHFKSCHNSYSIFFKVFCIISN